MASHGRGRGVRRNFEAGKETKVRTANWLERGKGQMGTKMTGSFSRLVRGERRVRMRDGGAEREERKEAELVVVLPTTHPSLKASQSRT